MGSVSWVCARVDASCGYDAEEEYRVTDVVERVDADAVAGLQTYCAETGGELADGLEGAAGGDVVGGVEGGDIDLDEWLGRDGIFERMDQGLEGRISVFARLVFTRRERGYRVLGW
jgi:hypothetical protein